MGNLKKKKQTIQLTTTAVTSVATVKICVKSVYI